MNDEYRKLVILAILDGWGIAPEGPGNAIKKAKTLNFDRYWSSYPHTELSASGQAVGLPRNEAGNTETGHLNIGAGRIVYQDLARINMSIADGSFFENKTLLAAVHHAKENNSNLHLMGLIGAGGVHSNIEHLFALIRLIKMQNFENLYLHLFTDGRDSPPTASKFYIGQLKTVLNREKIGKIASIMGRYWAMDRDQRWERTKNAYDALVLGKGQLVKTPEEAVDISYADSKTDEFIEPSLVASDTGKPLGIIKDNDSVIFFNFRIDRPRQLTKSFVLSDFETKGSSTDFDPFEIEYSKKHEKKVASNSTFKREKVLKNIFFVTMTEYSKQITASPNTHVAFPPDIVELPLGRVVSINNMLQLRIAESEKERFVTFYINGMREETFPNEDRVIVPSKKVATYDLAPEMSAYEITEKLLDKVKKNNYSLVIANFANADMVGHTGSIGPAVKACEVVDESIGKIANFVLAFGGTFIITADHGNAEEMINPANGEVDTEHSKNSVPFIAISKDYLGKPSMLPKGILADIAPTILSLLDLEIPGEMTGRDLLKELKNQR